MPGRLSGASDVLGVVSKPAASVVSQRRRVTMAGMLCRYAMNREAA
ncbi:hypothetical protein K3U94_16005 [Mycolicibacter heraklionensis]|uniref:Uncharacterized protein n=1 Tax=Mycolicibacter heraklionensis TaxID=512402 RepID=A0A9X7WFQ0_9MYCO|nr:hypothetical protein [Mycolicibacter heraklionensis]QZA06509.1 hypothetical protein K3U94_16005 [Mycolicibacter heraklionensis]